MSENNTPDSQDSHPSVARPLLNITSAIISALPAVDPRLLAVLVIDSEVNEIGAFFDAASIADGECGQAAGTAGMSG